MSSYSPASKMDLESKHEPEPVPASSSTQTVAALITRVLSLAIFIMLFIWVFQNLGGMGWTGSKHFFNGHPFFMILGIPVLLTNGMISWRDFGQFNLNHHLVKAIHGGINALALGSIAVGLFVTIQAHKGMTHLSGHSNSSGALIVTTFSRCNAAGGLLFYLLPVFPFSVRARVLPLHAWLGVVSYTCLMLTVLSGIIQFMAFQNAGNRGGYRSTTSVLSNVLGLVIFATLLCALWATIPRRNIAIDVEERDGVSIDDPSRSRLKGMTYATPTSRGRASATEYGGSNPFTGEAVPPRRSFATEERAF